MTRRLRAAVGVLGSSVWGTTGTVPVTLGRTTFDSSGGSERITVRSARARERNQPARVDRRGAR